MPSPDPSKTAPQADTPQQAMEEQLCSLTEELTANREKLHSANKDLGAVRELLAKHEAQLRNFDAVMASAQDFIYHFDLEGRFTFANRPLLDLWQLPLEEVLGKNFHELPYPTAMAGMLLAEIGEVVARGLPYRGRTPYTSPAGGTRQYEYIFTPLRDASGAVTAVAGVTRDITEQTEAEAALLLSEERLSLIVENAREYAIVSLDLERRVTTWNTGAQRLLGWTDAEIIGQSADVIFTEEDRLAQAPERESATALAEGRAVDERWHVRKDASRFWGSGVMMAMHDNAGRTIGLLKIFRDQTEARLADEARQEAEDRLRALVNQSAAGVAATDLQHRYTLVNERLCTLTGRSQEELLQMHWTEITHPDDLARSLELSALAMATLVPQVIEKRILRPDGTVAWVSDSISVLTDAENKPQGVIMVVIDITERILWQIEQASLLAQREKDGEALRLADRRKNEFLATLAHEIRNPLAPIKSALDVLNADAGQGSSHEAMGIIQRQVTQIVHLVEDLLDISRISEGKIRLRKERMNLGDGINSAIEASRPLILKAGHQLHISLPPLPLYVDADLVRISQVLLNLLNNAAKYTEPGGQIWLMALREGQEAVVRIKDSGVGIPAEMTERIFDIFTQEINSDRKVQSGLGIGLSLVKQLAEMHGGSVKAFSEGRGKGSEFVLRLPLAASQDNLAAPTLLEATKTQTLIHRKVLIVDDNVDAANMLKVLLTRSKHTVQAVYDAQSALGIVDDYQPDAVLLDIGLPDMDGCDLAKILHEKHPEMLLIAISGWGQQGDLTRTREAGCDYHFTKPVEIGKLKEALVAGRS